MMNKKMQRIVVAVIAVILAAVMILSMVAPAMASDMNAGGTADGGSGNLTASTGKVILDGVKVGGLDVSGMTEAEANQAVSAHVAEMENSVLTAKADGRDMVIAVKDLGFKWTNPHVVHKALSLGHRGNILARYKVKKDLEKNAVELPIEREFDAEAIKSFITQCSSTVNRAPVENSLQRNPDGTLALIEGSNGIQVDEQSSYTAMQYYLNTGWQGGAPAVDLKTTAVEPARPKEQLARVKDIIGSGETDYSGSSDARIQNLMNGTRLTSGTILMPGEQFSMLEHAIPFTPENGYAPASTLSEGAVIDTYGGGICQVSTTLYLAVLQAELQVDERYCHSMMVQYIEPSKDAAISEEGGKDLKFTNNTDAPVFIYGAVENGAVRFSIYGVETRPAGRTVNYVSNVLSKTDTQFILVADENMPTGQITNSGEPHVGYEAELWKETTVNGETTREWVNESSYRMTPVTFTIGVQTDNPAFKAAIMAAIAGGNLDKVNEVLYAGSQAYPMPAAPEQGAAQQSAAPEAASPQPAQPAEAPAEAAPAMDAAA